MINLIPTHARTTVTREYWMRVAVVWIFLFSSVLFLVCLLQFPSYVLLSSQLGAYNSQYQAAQLEQSDVQSSSQIVRDTNTLARHLATENPAASFSDRITVLDTLSGSGVTIRQFMLTQTAAGAESITISGVANTRSDLTQFSAAVTAHPDFAEAIVPIANLARDRDIVFEIDVVPDLRI